jgi:hypothetical protein
MNQRYQNGTLEEVIRSIINDVLEERFFGRQAQAKAMGSTQVGGVIRRRRRRKGRVTDPTKDRRLKENRKKAIKEE